MAKKILVALKKRDILTVHSWLVVSESQTRLNLLHMIQAYNRGEATAREVSQAIDEFNELNGLIEKFYSYLEERV